MSATGAPFRFLDLPAEVRKQIYQELLCRFAFEPARTAYHDSKLAHVIDEEKEYYVNEAVLDVDTSILLVNRAIYHEAYDVMIKTNQFVYVSSECFDMSEFLPRYKIPVVTMDRQRTKNFNGYVLRFATSSREISDDSPGDEVFTIPYNFAFMILGRHWKYFCEALPYIYTTFRHASYYLEFDPKRTGPTSIAGAFDNPYMQKIQQEMLKSLRRCLRGAENFVVYAINDKELADSVTNEVQESPWSNVPAWLAQLENNVKLAKAAREKRKLLEASGAFEYILEQLRLVEEYFRQLDYYAAYDTIIDECTLGIVQCCLLQWQSPPTHTSEHWYKRLSSIIKLHLPASGNARQPRLRALHHLYRARWRRLQWTLSCDYNDLPLTMPLTMVSDLAEILVRAEEEDSENKEIMEEGQKLLEMSGLEGMSIRELAAAL